MAGILSEGIELFCKEARIALQKLLINTLECTQVAIEAYDDIKQGDQARL